MPLRRAEASRLRTSALWLALTCLASGCATTSALHEGQRAERAQDYDRAVVEYTKAVREKPDDHTARLALDRARLRAAEEHFFRGRRLGAAERYEDALIELQVASELNPSSGDVSVFLPTEQAALAHTVAGPARTMAFAWYNLVGSFATAFGALCGGIVATALQQRGFAALASYRAIVVGYALLGGVLAVVFGGILLVAQWAGRPPYGVLISNLEPQDAGAVTSKLREMKVDYHLSQGGRAIEVPAEKVYDLRLQMATEGLPWVPVV